MYNMGSTIEALTGAAPLDAAPGLRSDFEQVGQQLMAEGCYPVRSPFDLMMTSVQTMMDANLALQIKGALRAQATTATSQPAAASATATSAAGKSGAASRPPALSPGLFDLAPEIITLCGGSLSPFDFALGKAQHVDLYHAGQLCTHLIAAQGEPREGALLHYTCTLTLSLTLTLT